MSLFHLKEKGVERWKRTLIYVAFAIIIFIILVVIFISPIAKYAIEKYGTKYSGRVVKTGAVYLNPFTGYLHIGNFRVHEPNSDSIFVSAGAININVALLKLLSGTYEVSSLTLDRPYVSVIKEKKGFNFSDLMEKQDTSKKENKGPMHLNVLNLKIKNGLFHYREVNSAVDYAIQKFDLKSPGMYWNRDSIEGKFSFVPGKGPGGIKGDFWTDLNKKEVRLDAHGKDLNMDLFEQYMKDFSNFGTIRAMFGFNMQITGNMHNVKAVKIKGAFEVNDFHFGKNPKEDYASFKKFRVTIADLEPLNKKYYFDTLQLIKPFAIYEMYDKMSNLDHMFGKGGENIKKVQASKKFNLILELSKYLKELFKDLLHSDYRINAMDVRDGDIKYNDYSLSEKFSLALYPLNLKANLVNKENRKVNIVLTGKIQPYGMFKAEVGMDPKNAKNYYLTYAFDTIPATLFNPYILTYSSYPLDRGIIQLNGNWKILGDSLQSMNHFLMVDPRIAQRVKRKENKYLPMPLIMAFVRERSNVIDYKIPITGDLKSPKFHLGNVIMNLLRNILLKPPTTPFGINLKNVENKVEKHIELEWPYRQTNFSDPDEKYVRKIADFLKDNKDAAINVQPETYEKREKEYILFFEAKRRYYLDSTKREKQTLDSKDSVKIDKMSTKDPGFLKYLDHQVKDNSIYARQNKCREFIGEDFVDKKYDQLLKDRQTDFMNYFKKNGTSNRITILENKNVIPFNGFSYYRIDYKGEIPKSLEKAYQKLQNYNSTAPRKKYQPLRKVEKPAA